MVEISEHVSVSAILQTAIAPAMGFGTVLHLTEDNQIPIDLRYRLTAKSAFADEYETDTDPYDFAQVFFAQKRTPDELMFGRWISEDSVSYVICDHDTTLAHWTAVTAGVLTIEDDAGTPHSVKIIPGSFAACTSFAQVVAKLNTTLDALVTPTIAHLEDARFRLDSMDRLVLEHLGDSGGASGVQLHFKATTLTPPEVDLATAGLLGTPSACETISGYDAEDPSEALAEISKRYNEFYFITMTHMNYCALSDANYLLAQKDAAAYVESQEKLLCLVSDDVDCKNAAKTSDIAYQCKSLTYKRTLVIYSERVEQYPDAAELGCVVPADEGTCSFAYEVLSGVSSSGYTDTGGGNYRDLTYGERVALKDKNCCMIQVTGTNVYLYNGITSGNEEYRIMLGRDWFVARIREAIFTDMLNDELHAFDGETFAKVETNIRNVGAEAIARRILVDTVERPFIVQMPDPDEVTAAMRASHTFDYEDIFIAYLNSCINDYKITGTWSI